MKATSLAAALIATVAQVASFLGLWAVAFYTAKSQGRLGRSDIGFDITVTYGVFLIGFLCLISSLIAATAPKKHFRWVAVGISTAVWSIWMIPSFDYHPYRGPVYFAIGCVVLMGGSIFLIPSIMRVLKLRASEEKRRENKAVVADANSVSISSHPRNH
jgi:hypothetical protein